MKAVATLDKNARHPTEMPHENAKHIYTVTGINICIVQLGRKPTSHHVIKTGHFHIQTRQLKECMQHRYRYTIKWADKNKSQAIQRTIQRENIKNPERYL
jgi:hypothetical protein